MNYLAHFHLAGDDPGHLLGALLGDFVKGPPGSDSFLSFANFRQLPESTSAGIALHRSIDARFDSLPEVHELRARLAGKHKRLHGIALDLLFDHFLALHWDRYHHCSLGKFNDAVCELLHRHEEFFGAEARRFSCRLREYRLLERYSDSSHIALIARRIATRWNKEKQMLELLDPLLVTQSPGLAYFERIYPIMQQLAAKKRGALQAS